MAITARSLNVLDIWFKVKNSEDNSTYKIRIQEPEPGLSREKIRSAISGIVQSRVFDFDDVSSDYYFVKARYTAKDNRIVVK